MDTLMEQERALWMECHQLALELEAFDPTLIGLDAQLSAMQSGEKHSVSWLAKASGQMWQSSSVANLTLKLNEIAGLHFRQGHLEIAQTIVECAIALHVSALGSDHETSKVLVGNLRRLLEMQQPKTLPKLRSFSDGRKPE